MLADLHTHSYYSDGAHGPDFVVNRASDNGVTVLALTDHDCVDGYLALRESVLPAGLTLVPGVEISTVWENHEIHILGLCIDVDCDALRDLLGQQRGRRLARIGDFDLTLSKAGFPGLKAFVNQSPAVCPGRSHVARFLATDNRYKSSRKAFRALAKNGRFYVKPQWCSLDEAVSVIAVAGGLSVLAHPHRYAIGKQSLRRLLRSFKHSGGHGMEVSCANTPPETLSGLASLSAEFELSASAGSDFHTAEATWMDIGRIRPLPAPAIKNAIWLHPGWH